MKVKQLIGIAICFCIFLVGPILFFEGCQRNLKQFWHNDVTGTDYVVVELRLDGTPYRCWTLEDVAIAQETDSDGIYWANNKTGNLIHVSGSYDYVQVVGDNWDAAFSQINMTKEVCKVVRKSTYNPDKQSYQ